MKTYDNTIKYFELLMKYDDTSKFEKYELPVGYHWEYYQSGDEQDWADIHISTGEFTSYEEGLKYFHDFYDYFSNDLNRRCVFIVEDETLEKVGTVTISLLKDSECGYDAAVDWLAIRSDYQGKGLAKPLISKTVELANEFGHKGIILHTQTTTWLAAKLYLDYGFEVVNSDEKEGWNILNTLTNHPKLESFVMVEREDIFDKINIAIERQLRELYGTSDFNYSVWYKDGEHTVYTYFNGVHYEYEYFIKEDGIELVEVTNKKYRK